MSNQSEADIPKRITYKNHIYILDTGGESIVSVFNLDGFIQKQIDRADELIKIIRNKDEWTDACEEKIKELKTRAEILKTKNEITHKRMMELIDREEDYLKEIKESKNRAEKAEAFVNKYKNHKPEHPDDERQWIPALMAAEEEISRLKAENMEIEEARVRACLDAEALAREVDSLKKENEELGKQISERDIDEEHRRDKQHLLSKIESLKKEIKRLKNANNN